MTNILILDDDPALLKQIAPMLNAQGYVSLLISHPQFLFERLQAEHVDLILLDIHLPSTDGVALLQQIKAHPLYQNIPVIILTVEMNSQLLAKCFTLGASDFINKPLEELVLKARVEAALTVKISKEKLEFLVAERTTELKAANQQLQREIEERKQIEKALIAAKEKAEEMNRLKSSFFANISHELRTPMNSIIGFATALEQELYDVKLQSFADQIIKNSAHLLDTLNDILDLSRLEANKQELKQVSLNLLLECQEIAINFKPAAAQKGLFLTVESQHPLLCAELDRGAFSQIMNNLIENALKFTQKGGIRVEIDPQENDQEPQVEIKVIDTGIGVSPQFLPFVFNEFEQESDDYHRQFDGAGIGLSIVRKLVELMNGKLTVTSEEGVGSTFVITFPLTENSHPDDAVKTSDSE